MKILITQPAEKRLFEIHEYYATHASLRIADRLIDKIFKAIFSIESNPQSGSPDEYLAFMNKGHRKVFHGNYKIVYRFTEDTIFITDVFDSMGNQKKKSLF